MSISLQFLIASSRDPMAIFWGRQTMPRKLLHDIWYAKPPLFRNMHVGKRLGNRLVAAARAARHHARDCHASRQASRRDNLQTVVIKRHLDVASVNRIVSMHHGIRYEFPQSPLWKFVDVMTVNSLYHATPQFANCEPTGLGAGTSWTNVSSAPSVATAFATFGVGLHCKAFRCCKRANCASQAALRKSSPRKKLKPRSNVERRKVWQILI